MNLPNKLTMIRMFLAAVIICILIFPFYTVGIEFPKYQINNFIMVNTKYVLAGIIFIIASFTDFLDGYIARKYNLITDFGKMIDAIADKVLVNSVLIILASQGMIPVIIAVIIILRDIVVNSIKMAASSKGEVIAAIGSGKAKTACLMIGITLTLFYNLPFEIWGLDIATFLLVAATVLSVFSALQYYDSNKNLIFAKNDEKDIIDESIPQ